MITFGDVRILASATVPGNQNRECLPGRGDAKESQGNRKPKPCGEVFLHASGSEERLGGLNPRRSDDQFCLVASRSTIDTAGLEASKISTYSRNSSLTRV